MYTETLAQEIGRYNITVNAICPGMVSGTNMMNEWQAEAGRLGLPTMEDRLPTMPLGRPATVADIANMAAFRKKPLTLRAKPTTSPVGCG